MVYAHTPAEGSTEWHMLDEHILNVAAMSRDFAAAFGAEDLAYWLGIWHDLGKCNPAFQDYLKRCVTEPEHRGHGPDHKAAGAKYAQKHMEPLSLLVQGHHGGLKSPTEYKNWLAEKEKEHGSAIDIALDAARALLPALDPPLPLPLPSTMRTNRHAAEFFLRMLFSTLVDADFLDTEYHFNKNKTALRGSGVTLAELWERLEQQQRQFSGQDQRVVTRARHAIYEACLAAASLPPGWFRLTVPTGGGKTRSGMAFALRHALEHQLQRIIVAVPFISITEQTADTYRAIFGAGDDDAPVVLEHHSSAQQTRGEHDEFTPGQQWARLAAENWDAPIVVTTTVQLFQSMFACGTSPCRKLHRLAKSVIILDEAQALPPHLLKPILDGLTQLTTHYGATVVLSTATQPAFEAIPLFQQVQGREIVPEPKQWFDALRRVAYDWRTQQTLSWGEIADLLWAEQQVLAIVNTKKDALALLDALNDPQALHLSTLLCGAHRRTVIAEVKRRLVAGEPCRLVSTQVVEAGVDLDFPCVVRALGPLDGVIQAAGRCNREGRLDRGRVLIVRPAEGSTPKGAYRVGVGITESLLGAGALDVDDPAIPARYFRKLFETVETDREGIQKLRAQLNYSDVAKQFRMIDDDTEDVIVFYGSEAEQKAVQGAINTLCHNPALARGILRRLRPYMVSLRTREATRYRQRGLIGELLPDALPSVGIWQGKYDPLRGVSGNDLDLEQLVV
ncbi:MAG: CRISPR-associated helicase Cas3' [Chloroflexales bacterium]|nr:CRISPR-associated helicase Cas3' [Chloroflexales bacterium]